MKVYFFQFILIGFREVYDLIQVNKRKLRIFIVFIENEMFFFDEFIKLVGYEFRVFVDDYFMEGLIKKKLI